jgi:serine/threonine-protein kinase
VTPGFTGLTVQSGAAMPGATVNRATVLAIGAAVVMTLLFVGSLVTRPAAPAPVVTRQRIQLMSDVRGVGAVAYGVALAPDGSAIVYGDTVGGQEQLWLKERGQERGAPIAGTLDPRSPFYAPDGSWVAFFADDALKKVSPRGGSPITLADSAVGVSRGGAWLDDGTIVFNHRWDLMRVSENGGEVVRLLEVNDSTRFAGRGTVGRIQPLPDGRGVLFVGCSPNCDESEVYAFDLATGEPTLLVEEAGAAWYAPTGHLVYVRRDGGMFAAPLDLESLSLTGAGFRVMDGIRTTSWQLAEAQLGRDGTLLYLKGGEAQRENGEMVWVDRRGGVEPVDPDWTFRAGAQAGVSLSPDGSRLAMSISGDGIHLWIKQLDRGPLTRLTFEGGSNRRAVWTPDGSRLRFISNRGDGGFDVWEKRADGSAEARLLLDLSPEIFEIIQSPDGEIVAVRTGGNTGDRDIQLVTGGDSATTTLLSGSFDETGPTLSPDGRWMAYVSDESGRPEIYVRPFPAAGASRVQVSKNGGREPLWAHSGRELFYVSEDRNMMAAQVSTDPTFQVTGEETLFPLGTSYHRAVVHRYYDVTADDQRFVMARQLQAADQSDVPDLILAEHWLAELQDLVGTE